MPAPEAQVQNEPAPEVIQQLPPVDNLLAHEVLEEEEGEVLAMDDLTDQSEEIVPPPPGVIEPVQIVEFPNFANFEHVIPAPEDEVQIEDLLGFVNLEDEFYQDPFHQNLQVGFVQLLQTGMDPAYSSIMPHKCFQVNPEVV